MSRRTLASLLVACLLLALFSAAVLLPVPYVTMSPGPTVDVLGKRANRTIIEVDGHRTYPTEGELRLTTVEVTRPGRAVGLAETLGAWFDGARAVYPRDAIYPPEQSADDVEQQSVVEMADSQDLAIAAALTELGYRLPRTVTVSAVTKGSPADGRLRVEDRLQRVNGVAIRSSDQVTAAIQRSGVGQAAAFVVRRGGRTEQVPVTAEAAADDADRAVVGVQIKAGFDFPFDVSVRLGRKISGPSAGLIFSLGIYDLLTPGSLSGGTDIAGTGTIDEDGNVGSVGGIQQKIVAAREAGAKIFLVPPGNCRSALQADVRKDEIQLVKASTMHSAVESLESYARGEAADLPACA
ncbi:MAG TPA: PDZ domain-containing protein [Nocardioidaceae bacterium]|nr:PDZ domain-containing protein [Nocardioidaceae bacterium]